MTDSALPPAPHKSTLTRRQLLAWRNALFVIFALSGLSLASWVARLPAVRDELGLDTAELGILIFAMSAGSVIGLIAAPPIVHRIGAKAGMLVALTVVAVGIAVIGVGADLLVSAPVVAVGLALAGFGNGSVDVMMNVEGAAAERAIGKTILPLMHAFFSFGTVTGAGVGALASGLGVSVAVHLAGIAVVIAVCAVLAIRFVPRGAETEVEATTGAAAGAVRTPFLRRLADSLSVWRDGRLLLIGLIMLGMAFAEGSANDWLTIAVVDGYGQSNTTAAVIFGLFTVSMTAGRVLGGPVLDRFGRVPVLRVSAAVGVLGLAAFIFAPEPWIAYVGVAFWAIGCSLGFPVGMSAAADTDDPKLSAARVSAVAIIGYVAFLVGPPVIGLLGHELGILNALVLVLVLVVIAGLASPAARERGRIRSTTGAGTSTTSTGTPGTTSGSGPADA
ncbi:MFS transporter [Herbiconiux sp. CPCC 203407]|uniref:MFS transporter n=1 Tax=Herbiconiux oxytropis TaxID=2970915 RepID=A0AA42BU89_9MICO|nr:MFS transporter [Herbiconiux oxytropis]MCS5724043.1 MFS transporter [Herbiconiux oxytropis]MCS5725104.1 MFS transporter [Herbiconiux oxytropis]